MSVQFDPSAVAMYIRLAEGDVAKSDEVRDRVVLDYDADRRVLGIELLNVRQRNYNPRDMAFELLDAGGR
jgi:uncharacterized protein YuzE